LAWTVVGGAGLGARQGRRRVLLEGGRDSGLDGVFRRLALARWTAEWRRQYGKCAAAGGRGLLRFGCVKNGRGLGAGTRTARARNPGQEKIWQVGLAGSLVRRCSPAIGGSSALGNGRGATRQDFGQLFAVLGYRKSSDLSATVRAAVFGGNRGKGGREGQRGPVAPTAGLRLDRRSPSSPRSFTEGHRRSRNPLRSGAVPDETVEDFAPWRGRPGRLLRLGAGPTMRIGANQRTNYTDLTRPSHPQWRDDPSSE